MEITGHTVRSRSFQTLGDDLVTGWLGASPDGLIEVTEAAAGTPVPLKNFLFHHNHIVCKCLVINLALQRMPYSTIKTRKKIRHASLSGQAKCSASKNAVSTMGSGGAGLRAAGFSRPPQGQGAGVLEIKCPFNKGEPTKAKPYKQAPWYYMPQVPAACIAVTRSPCWLTRSLSSMSRRGVLLSQMI